MISKHRLSGFDSEPFSSWGLTHAVHAISQRAEAVIVMLQSEYAREDKLNDEIIFQALDTVLMDVLDMREVVDHFYSKQAKHQVVKND